MGINCYHYNFMSAGGSCRLVKQIKKLQVDDIFFAYLKQCKHNNRVGGFMGRGKVKDTAILFRNYLLDDGRNLKCVARQNSLYINQVYIYQQNPDDLEVGEYVVRVKWLTPHQPKTSAYRPDPTNLGLTPNQLNGRYRTPISKINHLGLHNDLWGRFP